MENEVEVTSAEEDFGLFGDMDIESVPDDPWFVGAGWYQCSVTKSVRHAKKDSSGWAWIIEYTIDEPDSEYHGFTKSDWFDLHPLAPGQTYKDLDKDAKQDIIRMKNRIMQAFDRTEAEAAKFKPDDAMGDVVFMRVVERQGKNEHAGKTFSNIEKVISKRLFEEQNEGRADTSMGDVGLVGA